MGMRWIIRPVGADEAVEDGTAHEPFAYDPANDMVYTKEQVFVEDDEPKSSARAGN